MIGTGQQPYEDQLKALVLEDLATIHIIDVSYLATRFNETWCTNGHDRDGNLFNIVGGQSFTDLPIRTVVYPSYGVSFDDSYC